MKLGAQLYTLRDFCKTPEDIHNSLKRVAEIGYQTVQMSGIGKIDPAEFKKYCDEYGLEISMSHVGFDRIVNDTDKLIEEHNIMDCDYIGLGCPTPAQQESVDTWKKFAEDLCIAAEKMNKAKKHFCYHNHNCEFKSFDGGFIPYFYLMKTFPDHVNFTFDTYWSDYSGYPSATMLKMLAGRVERIHYKDLLIKENGSRTTTPVMEGTLDWCSIIAASKLAGVDHVIVEQDVCERDPFDCLTASYNNLKPFIK